MHSYIYHRGIHNNCIHVGESFLRIQVSAIHSTKDIEQAVKTFSDLGKAKGFI